jgi:hypothetical protein
LVDYCLNPKGRDVLVDEFDALVEHYAGSSHPTTSVRIMRGQHAGATGKLAQYTAIYLLSGTLRGTQHFRIKLDDGTEHDFPKRCVKFTNA